MSILLYKVGFPHHVLTAFQSELHPADVIAISNGRLDFCFLKLLKTEYHGVTCGQLGLRYLFSMRQELLPEGSTGCSSSTAMLFSFLHLPLPPHALETGNMEIPARSEQGSLQTMHLHSFSAQNHPALEEAVIPWKKITGNYLLKGHFKHAWGPTAFYFTIDFWLLVLFSLFIPSFQSLQLPVPVRNTWYYPSPPPLLLCLSKPGVNNPAPTMPVAGLCIKLCES